jgi:hypothetical protein
MNQPRRLFLQLGVLALSLVCARAETLTVATYNIENYCAANRVIEAGYRTDGFVAKSRVRERLGAGRPRRG